MRREHAAVTFAASAQPAAAFAVAAASVGTAVAATATLPSRGAGCLPTDAAAAAEHAAPIAAAALTISAGSNACDCCRMPTCSSKPGLAD